MNWLLDRLKWWIAGKELNALHRYRVGCHLAWRWNGRIRGSAETAQWIQQVGEGTRGYDIEQFRASLESNDGN